MIICDVIYISLTRARQLVPRHRVLNFSIILDLNALKIVHISRAISLQRFVKLHTVDSVLDIRPGATI